MGTRTIRVRISDEEYQIFQALSNGMDRPISQIVRDSALLWVAYTSQPLIKILSSEKYKEYLDLLRESIVNGSKQRK